MRRSVRKIKLRKSNIVPEPRNCRLHLCSLRETAALIGVLLQDAQQSETDYKLRAIGNSITHSLLECVFTRDGMQFSYLRMATVSASGELAQGQMTSGLRPLDWKTLRKASQEDMDPV